MLAEPSSVDVNVSDVHPIRSTYGAEKSFTKYGICALAVDAEDRTKTASPVAQASLRLARGSASSPANTIRTNAPQGAPEEVRFVWQLQPPGSAVVVAVFVPSAGSMTNSPNAARSLCS